MIFFVKWEGIVTIEANAAHDCAEIYRKILELTCINPKIWICILKIKNHQIFWIEYSPNHHQILITKAVVCILRTYTDSNLSHFLSILRFVLFLVHKYFKFSSFLWPTMTSFDNLSFLGTWTVFSMKLWFEAQNFSSNSIQMFPEIKVFQSKIGEHIKTKYLQFSNLTDVGGTILKPWQNSWV